MMGVADIQMQLKANEVDSWLKRPDPRIGAVLVYGPDRGLVSERGRAFAERSGLALDDPFSVIRLDAGEIDGDPGRLLGELRTVAMFADRRLVWVRNASGQKEIAEALALVEAGGTDALVLVEAGDLKKTSALRQSAEAGKRSIALPCYADDTRGLDALIDAECLAAGKTMTLDARAAARERLGGDRLASRGEIAKLILYAGDRQRIEAEDVMAIIGDASAMSVDTAVDAILAGDAARFDAAYAKVVQAGQHPFVVLAAVMRQFQALAQMRAAMDRDARSAAAVIATARPPVFFARKSLMETALTRLTGSLIGAALDRLQQAVLSTRRMPELAVESSRQVLLGLALANRAKAGTRKN